MIHPLVQIANRYVGTKAKSGKGSNADILNWAKAIGAKNYTSDETAWCALFANYVCYLGGYDGTFRHKELNPLWALDFAKIGTKVEVPEMGDLVVHKRGSGGHVGIVLERYKGGVWAISGNYSEQVKKHRYEDKADSHSLKAFIRLPKVAEAKTEIKLIENASNQVLFDDTTRFLIGATMITGAGLILQYYYGKAKK